MKWIPFLTPVKSLDFKDTEKCIKEHSGEDITILDVREPSEYKNGHIPGAVLIPLPLLLDSYDEIDPDKPVLVY